MDEDVWYFQVGGCLGILPAIAAFAGGWWYCAETYGFLIGFGFGWIPSLILAVLVEFGFMLLWGPALAAFAYFWVLPALRHEDIPADPLMITTTVLPNDAPDLNSGYTTPTPPEPSDTANYFDHFDEPNLDD